ncbi:hypothetical protein JTE90_011698 [Oedothorax gibbosus]|uniref:Uncharacterized protein n=1 Tax=Oedothorax gibbosus TaxID=931172 RepID=A0AAV6UVS2_9ARAC|nr:hypothetical protein JTE90_011698 [Oedothorax gibbosus]
MVLLTCPDRPRSDQDNNNQIRNIPADGNEMALPNSVYAAMYSNNNTIAMRGPDMVPVRLSNGLPETNVSMRPGSVVYSNGGPTENGSIRANSVASGSQRPKGLYIPNEQLRSRCLRYLQSQQSSTPGVCSTTSTTSTIPSTKGKG